MDIISHGLWGALLAKSVNIRLRRTKKNGEVRKLDPLLSAFWGFAPDLIAFTPVFLLFGGGILSGHIEPEQFIRPREAEVIGAETNGIFWVTREIYSVTHSAIVFFAVFFAVWAFRKFVLKRSYAFIWEMTPWLLHIAMDVFTHSSDFYPTPLLWPFSAWHFNGMPWSHPVILVPNYIALAAGFYIVRRKRKRIETMEEETLVPAVRRIVS
ncbi:MAG: hypothetical protein RL681_36 [Candidatus Parcubacteria bacterium]|jgi:hypothetical protein